MPRTSPYWFIRQENKLIQCSKEDFDRAITEGKSVKYGCYANKKYELIAEALEKSRMEFLNKPDLPQKFRETITNPKNVVEVQVITIMDPQFWIREFKRPKYHETNQSQPTN
jgi:hypothetical protein